MNDSHTIFRKIADDNRQIAVHLRNKGATIAGISLSGFGVHSQSDVVLSYPTATEFDLDPYYLGATVGPVANRVKDGCFHLLNRNHALEMNEPIRSNLLHGGINGLHQQTFQASPPRTDNAVVFSLVLPHLADGFPGDRLITVRYELLVDLGLQFDFTASTDRTTVMNMANHAYFNLGGPLSEHELTLNAGHYTPVTDRLVPTGDIAPLKAPRSITLTGGPSGMPRLIIILCCPKTENFAAQRVFGFARHSFSSTSSQHNLRSRCIQVMP